jgi:uncharacterized protein
MQEVSSKLMARFAECLAEEMAADTVQAPAMGTNEATPADAASGRTGATPITVDWAAAAGARAPNRLGGYDETPVGRLPTGPAADAALAAARAGQAPSSRSRPTDAVLDLGEVSRGAVLRRAIPPTLIAAAAIAALVVWRRHR